MTRKYTYAQINLHNYVASTKPGLLPKKKMNKIKEYFF